MPANDDPNSQFDALLQAAKGGDQSALEEILALTESRLRRVVDRRLGPKLQASMRRSDVLQNSYLAMLDALPKFEGHGPDQFVAWVAQMIENDIRRQHRWFGARKRRAPSRTSQRNLLASILMDPVPTPSAEMSRHEERLAVRSALLRLDADYARVIEWSVFEDLPHREVAERMGRTEGACRMLLLRARAALAIELERSLPDQDKST
jgi:RNA polymerase sigma-70 factor, ECF subfamily